MFLSIMNTHLSLRRAACPAVNYSLVLKEYSFTYCRSNLSASCPSKWLWIIISKRGPPHPFPVSWQELFFTVCVQLNTLAQRLCWWIKACYNGRSIFGHQRGTSLLSTLIIYFGERQNCWKETLDYYNMGIYFYSAGHHFNWVYFYSHQNNLRDLGTQLWPCHTVQADDFSLSI